MVNPITNLQIERCCWKNTQKTSISAGRMIKNRGLMVLGSPRYHSRWTENEDGETDVDRPQVSGRRLG